MLHFVVFFVTITILTIFLATKQRRPFDRFCQTAVLLLCILAQTSAVLLGGTGLFPAAAFALAALVLAHRSIVHFPPDLTAAEGEGAAGGGCGVCTATARETFNHGTWIVAALVAGLVSAFRV
jgi:hypothetical protein